MKHLCLLSIAFLFFSPAICQVELTRANECYDQKDYTCALDNYMLAYDKKMYKEEQKYLVEYRIGSSYRMLSQQVKAREYLGKAALSNPDYIYSFWDLGHSYLDDKQFTQAKTNYLKSLKLATKEADRDNLNLFLAKAEYGLKAYGAAIRYMEDISSRQNQFLKTDIYIGEAFVKMEKYDSALHYYQKSEANLKAADSLAVLATVKLAEGQCYAKLGQDEKALVALDEAVGFGLNKGKAFWEKGVIYARQKDYPKAIEAYKKALPFYENSQGNLYSLTGNIANCYKNSGNSKEYINWENKRKQYSDNPYYNAYRVASFHYSEKKFADAMAACEAAMKAYDSDAPEDLKDKNLTDYANVLALAGKIKLEKKDTAAAINYFSQSMKLAAGNYIANAGAGDIAWQRKIEADYKKHYADIYKTLFDTLVTSREEIATVYARSAYIDATLYKGRNYATNLYTALKYDSLQKEAVTLWPVAISSAPYTIEKYRNACISVLNQAIKKYASDKVYVSDLYNSKATLLLPADKNNIAKCLDEAVKLNPANLKAWENNFKFYAQHDGDEGLKRVDKLIAILKTGKDHKSLAEAFIYRGDFLWRLGKKELAKEAWQEALVWDSQNANAKQRAKL